MTRDRASSTGVEDASGGILAGEDPGHTVAAVDGREEPDAVAAEVVEEAIVAWMGTDDADTAFVVAHQTVPVEVVRKAWGPSRLRERPHLFVHRCEQPARELRLALVDRIVERVLRTAHACERDGVLLSVVGPARDVDVRGFAADDRIADVADRDRRPPRLLDEGGHVRDP